MERIITGGAFIGAVVVVIVALFVWSNHRVDKLLQHVHKGDVVVVEPDECRVLKSRGYIAPDSRCGYKMDVKVEIIKEPT